MIDALNKRLVFLKDVIQKLDLKNVDLIHARAEEYARENRNKFDVVTARAVAALPILLEYSLPTLKNNGYFIAYKALEDINIEHTLNILNSKIDLILKFDLPNGAGVRTLIKIIKEKDIILKYPRKFTEIKNRPL